MKPIEFVTARDAVVFNTPADIQKALCNNNLVIKSRNHSWEVLSYYYSNELAAMVLDIQKINEV